MTDFLLELRSEEIPARMQAGARENLAKLFARLSYPSAAEFQTSRPALGSRHPTDTTSYTHMKLPKKERNIILET
ncbi:hypothetical protein, partial [Sphingomonas sanguinis]|uniref:hypothetical protein n=1 Tax=Sphingomonas sanguinis TaxID=33051 RepID=UPI0019D32F93